MIDTGRPGRPDTNEQASAPTAFACRTDALQLYWLPRLDHWDDALRAVAGLEGEAAWRALVRLANCRVDFVETMRLDRVLRRRYPNGFEGLGSAHQRLALLGSSTLDHLLPGLRVAALRRNMWLDIYTGEYGQYMQELLNPDSPLHAFKPTAVQFCLDEAHLIGADLRTDAQSAAQALDDAAEKMGQLWRLVRERLGCRVIQQTVLPRSVAVLGSNEHRMAGSRRRLTHALNERLRTMADSDAADLLSIDDRLLIDGIRAWHDPALWHRAKQEISPASSHYYGDLAVRILAARLGRSAKCLVLDLDNTLWGGVIGDDSIEGIQLGQGHALGEAYVAFQHYVRDLSMRGAILAVCSKNDESIARAPFREHSEMVLRETDIACFAANWEDKAANLRLISETLKIGLEHIVFVDDNPFERERVRGELPSVSVPEMPEDPAHYAQCLADAGYFEAVYLTGDDLERTSQYQANRQRESMKSSTASLDEYLAGLGMELLWSPFNEAGAQRVTQLINKTNQFNLTARRYSESEVRALMEDPEALTLQLRLTDRFGDNGMIAVIIARASPGGDATIEAWLMSCRVLGRTVERATLGVLVEEARKRGVRRLVGEYIPGARNGMVRDHYPKLGFAEMESSPSGGRWELKLANYEPGDNFIRTTRSP